MSDWQRTTREIPFENLRREMVIAVRRHIEQYNLGSILSEMLMCVQTDSEKTKKGLLGGTQTVYAGVMLTPRWLIWAVSGSKAKTSAHSAQLRDVVVQDYAQTQFVKMIPDSGLEISRKFTDVSENGSAFIGLEDGAAGIRFRKAVIQAVQEAKK